MIHGMLLVRNEKDRWLKEYLEQMIGLCDRLVIVDDDSTDGTAEMCIDYDCFEVYTSYKSLWGENEVKQRKRLWDLTVEQAKNDEWIICLDADELLLKDRISHVRYLLNVLPQNIDSVGFKLYDMWSDTHYREDQFWQAHKFFYPMAVRYKKDKKYNWSDKKLHCGRFPLNSASFMLPTIIPIKHMGWSREEDRKNKYLRYMEVDSDGKNGILGQYLSIIDDNPNLIEFDLEV